MSVIIRLQGLPLSASSADIRSFFSGLQIPDGGVNIVGGEDGDAFIRFTTDEDARQAMRKNNGNIHNSEVCLSLSSIQEMKEVINRAGSAPRIPPNLPSLHPMYDRVMQPPRSERDWSRQLPSSEDPSQFGRDLPPYGMNGDDDATRSLLGEQRRLDDSKGTEGGQSMRRPLFDINERSAIADRMKSNDGINGDQTAPWMNRGIDFMADSTQQITYDGGMETSTRQGDIRDHTSTREDIGRADGMGRIGADGNDLNGRRNTEESWRSQNIRSFERMPILASNAQKEEEVSFFGRGASLPKRPLLHAPSFAVSSIPPPHSSSHPSPMQTQKEEEVFVELTRLPTDLLRPSLLENFLAPSIPLKLSSVKVVYSPEGIHLQSLVRFTSAMDAFNALKKDGEQGVKIRPSTKEAFENAREGPPPLFSHLPPPLISFFPPFPNYPSTLPMGGMVRPGIGRIPQLMGQNELMMMNDRRGRGHMDEGREERRRGEDSAQRGRGEERGMRSDSPRSKRPRVDRVCVLVSNLPFRTKEPEIRRMLGPGLNPFCIKKIFNEDNSPSDVWIMEFCTEGEANETVQRRMELGGRQARLKRIGEEEADRLLRQKFKSPPRRGEKEGRNSLEEKVRMQQEAIELEGAFTGPVFTTTRGFMRGRGRGGMTRGRGGTGGRTIATPGNEEKNTLLVSNMPPLPAPAMLLKHLRIIPTVIVRIDQIAPDAAIIELRGEREALAVAEYASGHQFPLLLGRRLLVAALGRRQMEEEFNRRREIMERGTILSPSSADNQQGELPR